MFVITKTLTILLFPFIVLSQVNYPKQFDDYMQAQVRVNQFNGNVLVAKSGHVLYQKAFGYRNYTTGELLDNNSVFELASVSKQFTAMGILLLVEKGKLSFSDTLRKFFPELPYYNITIHNLLTHTSGLPNYMGLMFKKWDHKKIAFNSNMIEILAKEKVPADFEPGTKWEYSNTGYAILASIIERVSGLSFREYMYQNIFNPLGMSRSRVYNTRRSEKDSIPDYAFGYVYSDSLKRYIIPDSLPDYDVVIFLDGIQGDGTINSTTSDLLKWDRALKNHLLLSEATQNKMFFPQSLMDTAANMSYGYGVMIGKGQFGNYIYHNGGWPGYWTSITRYLSDDVTIIALSNNESNASGVSKALAAILKNQKVIFPYLHKEISVDTSWLRHFVGHYIGDNTNLYITQKDGKLYRTLKGGGDVELKPESKSKIFYTDGSDRQFEFDTNEYGNVTRAWLIENGFKKEINKVTNR